MEPAGRKEITHDAHWLVAFGEHGEALLLTATTSTSISIMVWSTASPSKKPLPDDVPRVLTVNKAVSARAACFYIRADTSDTVTHELRLQDLEPADILHHKGRLSGVVHPNTLLYCQGRGEYDWTVTLHHRDGKTILKPPPGRKWEFGLSVCRAGETLIVVETWTQSLDVFTTSGNILLLFLSYEFQYKCVQSLMLTPGLVIL